MEKIKWCKNKGLKLVKPNDNLAEEYFLNAEETLRILNKIKDSKSNMWLATQKYYCEYFAAYSILMKFGIKSEIHSCTIEIIKLLEKKKIIDFEFSDFLEKDKELRIDNQYYLKNIPVEINSEKLSRLLLDVKELLDNIDQKTINLIRTKIKEI